MKKALIIAYKDFRIRLYDRTGFAFLVVTPLIITLIMGAVFGGNNEDNEINFRVPVAIINYDEGVAPIVFGQMMMTQMNGSVGDQVPADAIAADPNAEMINFGTVIAEVLTSEDLAEILTVALVEDEVAARAAVETGESYCCLVIFPANFSRGLMLDEPADVIIYSDPASTVNRQIVESIVGQMVRQFAANSVQFDLTLQRLAESDHINSPLQMLSVVQNLVSNFGEVSLDEDGLNLADFQIDAANFSAEDNPFASSVTVKTIDASGEAVDFDPLAFFAPSLAIMFLAFGASAGAQSIRDEEVAGTFDRLNASPIASSMILLGKLLGTFISSAFQFGVLLILSVLLFGVRWGDPLAVLIIAILIIAAFTSLGLVMAVIAKDANQASVISNAVLITFALIGGNLTPAREFPTWLQSISRLTPNYWSVESFVKLGLSEGLSDLGPEILALTVISFALFTVGAMFYRRRAMV